MRALLAESVRLREDSAKRRSSACFFCSPSFRERYSTFSFLFWSSSLYRMWSGGFLSPREISRDRLLMLGLK